MCLRIQTDILLKVGVVIFNLTTDHFVSILTLTTVKNKFAQKWYDLLIALCFSTNKNTEKTSPQVRFAHFFDTVLYVKS